MLSDQKGSGSSTLCVQGGTIRWMSPELLYPEQFDLIDSRPTKESDCYALGMVHGDVRSPQWGETIRPM